MATVLTLGQTLLELAGTSHLIEPHDGAFLQDMEQALSKPRALSPAEQARLGHLLVDIVRRDR